MSPTPPDQQFSQQAGEVLVFWAKIAGAAVAVWQLVERVAKPLFAWRRKRFEEGIRLVLKSELDCITGVISREEEIKLLLERVIQRQEDIFGDMDLLVQLAEESHSRIDEQAALLDAAGFASRDRRTTERRTGEPPMSAAANEALSELHERRRERRRRIDEVLMRPVEREQRP